MTLARRVAVVCAVITAGTGLAGCNVLRHAAASTSAPGSAAADALPAPAAPPGSCPVPTAQVEQVLGGRWTASSLPSGGCSYAQGARTVMASTVPLPRTAADRRAALDRVRQACDSGSTHAVTAAAFVCRQDTLVEAAAVAGDRLLVLCTAAGDDPSRLPAVRAALGRLAASAR